MNSFCMIACLAACIAFKLPAITWLDVTPNAGKLELRLIGKFWSF